MNFFSELVDLCYKVVFLFAVFGVTTGLMCVPVWLSGKGQQAPLYKKNKKQGSFAGAGQSLGRASQSHQNAARTERLLRNRVLAKAASAQKTLQDKLRMIQDIQKSRPEPIRWDPPKSSGALPEELEANHFFMDSGIKFIALPPMPRRDDATAILRRLAQEFTPIIRKRQFAVRSVSEMCCCGDGLEYELGGEKRSVAAGESIAGHDSETVAGYNGKLINRYGLAEHVIHLRLRTVKDHACFMAYEEIVDTMAHELAHCVHEDHGPEFWELMEDILRDRAKIADDWKNGNHTPLDPVADAKEQFGGFNIYSSALGQMRNWNGQGAKAQR